MSGILFVLDQRRLIDRDGVSSGGTITFYTSGTSIKAPIYTNSILTIPMSNPVVVDADANIPNIYLDSTITYRRVIVYNDGSSDDVDPYISTDSALASLYTTLASSTGANAVGFSHNPTASVRTIAAKLQQQKSPIDAPYNAVGDGVADDTASLNSTISSSSVGGAIFLPSGTKFKTTSLINPYGVGFVGGGQVVVGSGVSSYQVNDYARTKGFVVGKEYLYRLYSRIGATGTTLTGFIAGDSTVARGNTTITGSITTNVLTVTNAGTATLCPGTFLTSVSGSPQIILQTSGTPFGNGTYTISTSTTLAPTTINVGNGGGFAGDAGEPQVLLPKSFRRRGVRNLINLTNVGIGGTNWSQANVTSYLGPATDILFLKYGINLVSGQDIAAEINAMRATLANIRAQTYGRVDLLTIVLISPTSTFDLANGRTSAWYELLRGAYEQAARDYKCCYVDLYGMFQDSSWWAGVYADTPAVHANGFLQQQFMSEIANAILPFGSTQLSTGDDWITVTPAGSYTAYDNGFKPLRIRLKGDGEVDLIGGLTPPGGVITVNDTLGNAPNGNYYPDTSIMIEAYTFSTTNVWGTIACGVDVAGRIFAREAKASISALIFPSSTKWDTRTI